MLAEVVVVVASLTSVVFIALCACPKKVKPGSALDTDTPLPNVPPGQVSPRVSNTPAPIDDANNLYDEAKGPPTVSSTPASVPNGLGDDEMNEDPYEDVEASRKASSGGVAPARSQHTTMGIHTTHSSVDASIAAKRSVTAIQDMKIATKHSKHHMGDSVVNQTVDSTRSEAGMNCVDEDESPPPVPQKTEFAEILYDVGPGTRAAAAAPPPPASTGPGTRAAAAAAPPASAPGCSARASPSSVTPQTSLPNENRSMHSVHGISQSQSREGPLSQTSMTWLHGQNKIEEDEDVPPPPVPQKTAEAQMIYDDAAVPAFRQETTAVSESRAAIALTKQSPVEDFEDDEAAPCLPPKTAEAEELYDYAGPAGPKRRSLVVGDDVVEDLYDSAGPGSGAAPTTGKPVSLAGTAYTAVSFGSDEPPPPKPALSVSRNPPEETSVYADVAFQ